MSMFKLTTDEKVRAMELLAAHPELKVVVFKREVENSMLFNHMFHSARWFWTHGMKRRAVVQFLFMSSFLVGVYCAVQYIIKKQEEEYIISGKPEGR